MRMIQQTSLHTFYTLDLGKRELEVYSIISGCPRTNLEISRLLGRPINCVTGRTRGLVKKGMVKDSGERIVETTGRSAIVWRRT